MTVVPIKQSAGRSAADAGERGRGGGDVTAARTKWEASLGSTGSPIESEWLAAFCEAANEHGYRIGRNASSSLASKDGYETIGVQPQKAVFRYIVDFVVQFWFRDWPIYFAIECDGYEFHQKTKQQADNDTARERVLVSLGYRVLRFTGRQINADARACAMEALDQIMDWQTSRIVAAVKRSAG